MKLKASILLSSIILLILYLIFFFRWTKKEFDSEGKLIKEYTVNLFNDVDGTLVQYYENGGIKVRSEFKDGLQYGYTEKYYKSGILKSKSKLRDGVLVDTSYFYNEDGTIYQKRIVAHNIFVEFDSLGREIKRGQLSEQEKFTGFTRNYYGQSDRWKQMVFYRNDSIIYLFDSGKNLSLLNKEFKFSLSIPDTFEFELKESDSVAFSFNTGNENINVDVMVYEKVNKLGEIESRIKRNGVDSVFSNVVRNYHDDRVFESQLLFYHTNDSSYVDLILWNHLYTYFITTNSNTDYFKNNSEVLTSVIESFKIVAVEVD